ncbi:MAG: hypothetical protein P4L45_12140 [Ignavibacteriaceae bacterium]|nr:hypothetical protein [Ignavibacteriaceae bacterium]
MKDKSVLLFFLSLLLFTGCSTTYTLKDFTSKQEFYSKFNSSLQDRNARAQLMNDSVIDIKDGAEVLNDTLYLLTRSIYKANRKFALQEIKNIKYLSIDSRSADISLKNDTRFLAESIKMGKDSIEFSEVRELTNIKGIAPVDKVKSVSYKNNWKGIYPGAVTGFIIGTIAGVYSTLDRIHNQQYNFDTEVFTGSSIGILAGSIAGSYIGWRYVYQFNVQY